MLGPEARANDDRQLGRLERGFQRAGAHAGGTFSVPGITHVEIHTDKANTKSQGVPGRLGFLFVGETPDEIHAPAELGVDCAWRMDRARWQRDRSAI